jgi:hypothetical protein
MQIASCAQSQQIGPAGAARERDPLADRAFIRLRLKDDTLGDRSLISLPLRKRKDTAAVMLGCTVSICLDYNVSAVPAVVEEPEPDLRIIIVCTPVSDTLSPCLANPNKLI